MERVRERGVASYALSKKDLRGMVPGLDIGCGPRVASLTAGVRQARQKPEMQGRGGILLL